MTTTTIPAGQPRRLAYKVNTAAEMLDVSEPTVWRLVNDGVLKTVRLRGSVRVTADSLHRAAGLEGEAA